MLFSGQAHRAHLAPSSTRAAKWAYFSTTLDDSLPLFPKLPPLEQTRQLTVRRGDQAAAPEQASPAVQPASDNKLDFL